MNEMTVSPKSCCESMNSFVRIYNYLNVLSERCGRKMKIYIFKIECKRICRINFFVIYHFLKLIIYAIMKFFSPIFENQDCVEINNFISSRTYKSS